MALATQAGYQNPVPAQTSFIPLENPVVVISPYFLAQYPVDLTVLGKVFTLGENDFDVVDVEGTKIFKIKSKLLSIHDKRKLLDAAGNVLISFHQNLLTLHNRWRAFRGDSSEDKDLLFTVKRSKVFQLATKLDVFLAGNKEEKVPDFHVKGSWSESYCSIYLGDSDKIVAQMYRKHDVKSLVFGTDKLSVTIYPNVDYAFIISLVVILDEINADRSGAD